MSVNDRLVYVRIITPEDAGGRTVDSDVRLRAELRGDESPLDVLSILLAGNLNAQRLPRPCLLLAQVIHQLQQWHTTARDTECGRAEQSLFDAASEVVEAWERHDESSQIM